MIVAPAGKPSMAALSTSVRPSTEALASPPPPWENPLRTVRVPTPGTVTLPPADGSEASSTPAACSPLTVLAAVLA